jgi:hypothetical protein
MTVAEALKQAGMTDEQITALDAKAIAGFTTVLTTAEQERQQAELAQRAATQMFENEITPALNAWGQKEATLSAERDYWKTLAEKAKTGGFLLEAPPFQGGPQRDDAGRFVANANPVPGSPNLQEFERKLGSAFGVLADLQWKYRSLHGGKEMPDSPTALSAEADAQRMPLVDYVAKKYDFAGRQAALDKEVKDRERETIRKEAVEERDKYWAERTGSNPNVRMAQTSQFTEIKKAVTEGKREDPLKLTREQRHAATAAAIREDLATKTVQ